MIKRIQLTKGEAEWAAWAIDPMEEFWKTQIEEGEVEVLPKLPKIEFNLLIIPDEPDVIDDFLDRIENQATDMIESEAPWRGGAKMPVEAVAGAMKRPIKSLAKKIRKAFDLDE